MWQENSIFREDIADINKATFIPWEQLKNSTVFITGATGLIGSALIRVLSYMNETRQLNISLLALVRDAERAKEIFSKEIAAGYLKFIVGRVEEPIKVDEGIPIDYVIHGASQTASKKFVTQAVETIKTAVTGTENLLALAKQKKVKGFVYLSSMEVYGYPLRGHKVIEEEIGALSPLDLRNSYPLSKQLCEMMCCAYAKEYGVPTKIIRLTQTFGPGVHENDQRIFAYFAKCVLEKKDIVLKTKGETERCYLYTMDAVTAILTVLLKGLPGEAYNAADSSTYCSIREMAEKVAADGGISVKYDITDEAAQGFPRTLYMNLDTTKLENLGWHTIHSGGGN